MFKIGDKVECLTDKYKMLTLGEIDIVHAVEPNGFVRLKKTKRYKYKPIYFKLTTKDKGDDVPKVWRNPFKFQSDKPDWETLWNKIFSTYSTSIDEFTIDKIRILTFFYLSKGEWEKQKRSLLDEKAFKNMLRDMDRDFKYNNDNYKDLLKYTKYLNKDHDIPIELYATFLCNYKDVTSFISIFDIAVTVELGNEIEQDQGSTTYDIFYKERIMEAFSEYITIIPSELKNKVETKEDMENAIFHGILDKADSIHEFEKVEVTF